ncbi:sterol carrier family protein [Curtobacterium sp. VKM Ac-1395]|uniref:sterol carrier family protein n=1 Tax=Curtobacterium sp. VKM Ac-1395 TaxID=2783815 RepID=UPI00188CA38B|nr:sterol carrier family protein [Curtobacterium sp. VKM Ac-1395]MBF4589343.1 hypothetical protein [Curtobacterium sp. VKM Ac-1395]
MPGRTIDDAEGAAALRAVVEGATERPLVAMAVRWTLQRLAEDVPGNSVEVRVPPFAAVQAVPGPRHTRGTPPNVIETDAATWIALATGTLRWDDPTAAVRVSASGSRADLASFLPVRTHGLGPVD